MTPIYGSWGSSNQLDWTSSICSSVVRTFSASRRMPKRSNRSSALLAHPAQLDWPTAYECVSFACQTALKRCKAQHAGVCVCSEPDALLAAPLKPPVMVSNAPPSRLRWSSERYLREKLYFRRMAQPVLFQFNPVYQLTTAANRGVWSAAPELIEKYRGNLSGMGLKGINELLGQDSADWVIRQLMSLLADELSSMLAEKKIPVDQLLLAQFVDRFTLCCEQPVFGAAEIPALVHRLGRRFNALSTDCKITHFRLNLVTAGTDRFGYQLFQQLTLTGLAPQANLLGKEDPEIELRQNTRDGLAEGRLAQEQQSYTSARYLAASDQPGSFPKGASL
jgi:hypothetical protein